MMFHNRSCPLSSILVNVKLAIDAVNFSCSMEDKYLWLSHVNTGKVDRK